MDARLTISVLLPVHRGVAPEHLARCLESIYAQTRMPDEIVIVEDGPLNPAQTVVLDACADHQPPPRRLALPVNSGAGVANQTGLVAATSAWIAKMDADDIAAPERFARQADVAARGEFDVIGSAMMEFDGDDSVVTGIRSAPLTHDAIARRMRINSPMNHPTTFYRRDLALAAGGYPPMRLMQDYVLFARMLAAGARFGNLPEPLVRFRADDGMFRRRASAIALRCEFELQRQLRETGLIGRTRQVTNLASRIAFRVLPVPLLRPAYRALFVQPVDRID